MAKLKVAIATAGRYHVLDLARELGALGYEVSFYSYVPKRRAMRFGLPARCHRGLLPFVAPLVAAQRFGPRRWRNQIDRLTFWLLNRLVMLFLQPCDVFICMSGIYVEAAAFAKQRYGARIYLERGSRHILSQREILDTLRARGMPADSVPEFAVDRELSGYSIADRIVVPSRHAERSFIEKGVTPEKIFRNPYGVDLNSFRATSAAVVQGQGGHTVLYVGAWSFQKGVDVLTAAWKTLDGVRLMHVGAQGDAPLPRENGFEHFAPVPQWRLPEFYSKADLFVLASRQEGLSLVLVQALAAGLPIVCTEFSGGEDLRLLLPDPSVIEVVPCDDVEALARAMQSMLQKINSATLPRDLLGVAMSELGWSAYGRRWDRELSGPGIEGENHAEP
jgi:glycosyltransferase involved in cell wall biosynthesis